MMYAGVSIENNICTICFMNKDRYIIGTTTCNKELYEIFLNSIPNITWLEDIIQTTESLKIYDTKVKNSNRAI